MIIKGETYMCNKCIEKDVEVCIHDGMPKLCDEVILLRHEKVM